jgi:predicted acyl esterase
VGAADYRTEPDWPPPGVRALTLHLGRAFVAAPDPLGAVPTGEAGELSLSPQSDGAWTWVDTGASTEEASLRDPLNHGGHGYYSLFYASPPLAAATRLAGSAVLDATVAAGPGSHLTPLLVEVLPDGTLKLVERGFLNLDYRDGLPKADPAPAGEWVRGRVALLPQDHTFSAGSRIGLILQSSNTVWAVPGSAGVVNVANGPVAGVTSVGTTIDLPLVGAPANPFA